MLHILVVSQQPGCCSLGPGRGCRGWHQLPQPEVFQALRPNFVKVLAVQFPNVVWERQEN